MHMCCCDSAAFHPRIYGFPSINVPMDYSSLSFEAHLYGSCRGYVWKIGKVQEHHIFVIKLSPVALHYPSLHEKSL